MEFIKKYDNGLRLVVKKMDGLMSVTMGIIVGSGAAMETDSQDGISHFIEHMQFKGTNKRNAFEISDAFDRIGAQVNAYTGKDATVYYTKSTSDHAATAFEVLADLFLNATYPEEEMAREKGVICEEIAMNEDTPDDLALDLLASATYGNEYYGRNILGPAKNVKSFTIEDVKAYKDAWYRPENIVISFAGAIDFETAQALVENNFGALEGGKFKKPEKKIKFEYKKLKKQKPIEQTHLAMNYRCIPRDHELFDAMQAACGILGGNMSSRLFQEVREKRGLAYSVYSYLSTFEECGTLNIYAGVNPAKVNEAYDAIQSVVADLKKNGVTESEFERSREQMKSSLLFANENTSSQMILYGKYLLQYDEMLDFEARMKRINQIKRADLIEAISLTFNDEERAMAAIYGSGADFDLF